MSSAHALKRTISAHVPRHLLVVGLVVALSLVVAGAAYASSVYFYYSDFASPGVPHSSPGWNYRDYNRVCRNDTIYNSFGLARAADYDSDGYKFYDTGQVETQCQLGYIARIEQYGYWLTRCWNSDTGGMILVCQTTKP